MALFVSSPVDPGAINTTAVSTTPYTLLLSDYALIVNTSVARTITLPNPAIAGEREWLIVDDTGSAETNPITLDRFAAETINGAAADYECRTNFGTWRLICDGVNWKVSS